jgi:hypothetical protein
MWNTSFRYIRDQFIYVTVGGIKVPRIVPVGHKKQVRARGVNEDYRFTSKPPKASEKESGQPITCPK